MLRKQVAACFLLLTLLVLGACTLASEPLLTPVPESPPIPTPTPEPIKNPPQLTYILKVAITPTEAGSVTSDPDFSMFSSGTNVTLTAIPTDGYLFNSWSGDISSTEPTITINYGLK